MEPELCKYIYTLWMKMFIVKNNDFSNSNWVVDLIDLQSLSLGFDEVTYFHHFKKDKCTLSPRPCLAVVWFTENGVSCQIRTRNVLPLYLALKPIKKRLPLFTSL